MDEPPLPPLRPDIRILRGPADLDGSPTWTLHDPVRHRFFRLAWPDFEILSRWGLITASRIAEAVTRETALQVDAGQVRALAAFFARNHLLAARDAVAVDGLASAARSARNGALRSLLHGYLFFRIPLVHPDRFLDRTYPFVKPLFSGSFLLLILVLGFLGLHVTLRQWDQFATSFMYVFSLPGLLTSFAALAGAKVLHELAHAYTAKRHGCHVPSMGIAFIVAWPVLFTDTTEAWKIPRRGPRLAIAAAGVGSELAIALLATFLWSFLPEGPARTALVLVASVTWITSLALNLNPFMKFDGYYLLSDALDMPNLQPRSFALARWKLREALFGWGDPPPERLPPGLHGLVLAYGYATWVYRLFLYLAIALAVYHFVFKLAGLALLVVELGWFVGRPVWQEFGVWWKERGKMRFGIRTLLGLSGIGALVWALFTPWPLQVDAPGTYRAVKDVRMFSPLPARAVAVDAVPGRTVAKGDVLVRMRAEELDQAVRVTEARLKALRWQVEHAALRQPDLENLKVAEQRLAEALVRRAGHEAQRRRLVLRAPMAGTVAAIDDGLRPGRWYDDETPLVTLVDRSRSRIEAFVRERDLGRVRAGQKGRFFPENLDLPPFPVRVVDVDRLATRALETAELASMHGGPIPAREGPDGRLVPEEALYRLRLAPEKPREAPRMVVRGTAFLEGAEVSLAERAWERVMAVLIRESGF